MRHIYVKTPDGLGKLSYYEENPWDYNYIVEHYKNSPMLYTGKYNEKFVINARIYNRDEIQYIKRPLVDLIAKRKKEW